MLTAAAISKMLPKVYEATATLWVSQGQREASFDSVQASQVLARTYSNIADSETVAEHVATRVPFRTTARDLRESVAIKPVPETQLIEITAEGPDSDRAELVANTYATVFRDYAARSVPDARRSSVSVASPARSPSNPARPQPLVNTGVGTLLGLLAGLALAFLRDRLDTRLRSEEDVAELLNLPILARAPQISGSIESQASYDDALAMLRTNLQFAQPAEGLHSLAVVSSSESEGKTTLTANLAKAFASTGRRVLAVEGDMRRPALSNALLEEGRRPPRGLSQYLAGVAELKQTVFRTATRNVWLLPSGPLPPEPSALLEAARGHTLIERLSQVADVVIIDTPPLSVGSEASLFAAASSGTLFVADLARSSRNAFQRGRDQLSVVNARVLGIVLNRTRGGDEIPGYYGYYRTGSGSNGRRRAGDRTAGATDESLRRRVPRSGARQTEAIGDQHETSRRR